MEGSNDTTTKAAISKLKKWPSKSPEPKWSSPAVSLGCTIFVDHSVIVLGAVYCYKGFHAKGMQPV